MDNFMMLKKPTDISHSHNNDDADADDEGVSNVNSAMEQRPRPRRFLSTSCLLRGIWTLLFCFTMTVGGIVAISRSNGPQMMFGIIMAMFLLSLVLPPFAHDGSVMAASFLFMILPVGPMGEFSSYGTSAWTWITASVFLVCLFQTRSLLLLWWPLSSATKKTTTISFTFWKDFLSHLLFCGTLLAVTAIPFLHNGDNGGGNTATDQSATPLISDFTFWRVVATLAWLSLILLLILSMVVLPWHFFVTLVQQSPPPTTTTTKGASDGGAKRKHHQSTTSSKLLYTTLIVSCMVNMLTCLLSFYPSDWSAPCLLATFLGAISAAYVSLNHGNRYIDAVVCRTLPPTPNLWNDGQEFLINNNNNNNNIVVLYSGQFAPRIPRDTKRCVVMLLVWILTLIVTPLVILSCVTFARRAYLINTTTITDNPHNNPTAETIVNWLVFGAQPIAFVLLFFISWIPLRYKVVQSINVTDTASTTTSRVVALVVECAGATYVYDHVHQVYQDAIASHIEAVRAHCTNSTRPGSVVVVVTTNQHIVVTPQDPPALIRAISLAVLQQQQQGGNLEFVVVPRRNARVGDMAPLLLHSGGERNSNPTEDQTAVTFVKLVKHLVLIIWGCAVLGSVVWLFWFRGHGHPVVGLGLNLILLSSSAVVAPTFAMDASALASCIIFFLSAAGIENAGGGSDSISGNATVTYANDHLPSEERDLWIVVAANGLLVVFFQAILLSRCTGSCSSPMMIWPSPIASWMLLPVVSVITVLLMVDATEAMLSLLAILAVTALVALIMVAFWLVSTVHVFAGQRLPDNHATKKLLYASLTTACVANLLIGALNKFPSESSVPCSFGATVLSFLAVLSALQNGDGYVEGKRKLIHRSHPVLSYSRGGSIGTLVFVTSLIITPFANCTMMFIERTKIGTKHASSGWIWLSVTGLLVTYLSSALIGSRPVRFSVVQSEETSVIALVVECFGATCVYDHVTHVYKGVIPPHVTKRAHHLTDGRLDGIVVVTANIHILMNPEDTDEFVTSLEQALLLGNEA